MRKRVFKDHMKLKKMFYLRRRGYSLISLGIIFGVDYSTIYHHCKNNHITKNKSDVQFTLPNIIAYTGVQARRPKTYMEYLIEDARRNKIIR